MLALVILLMSLGTEIFNLEEGIIERAVPWILFFGIFGAGGVFTFVGGLALRRFDVSRPVS